MGVSFERGTLVVCERERERERESSRARERPLEASSHPLKALHNELVCIEKKYLRQEIHTNR